MLNKEFINNCDASRVKGRKSGDYVLAFFKREVAAGRIPKESKKKVDKLIEDLS